MSNQAKKVAAAIWIVGGIVWAVYASYTTPQQGMRFDDPAFTMASSVEYLNALPNGLLTWDDMKDEWKSAPALPLHMPIVGSQCQFGNGAWEVPMFQGEMFDARVAHLWASGDPKGKACKVEWTDEGMRFWCEDGRFDVIFGGEK